MKASVNTYRMNTYRTYLRYEGSFESEHCFTIPNTLTQSSSAMRTRAPEPGGQVRQLPDQYFKNKISEPAAAGSI